MQRAWIILSDQHLNAFALASPSHCASSNFISAHPLLLEAPPVPPSRPCIPLVVRPPRCSSAGSLRGMSSPGRRIEVDSCSDSEETRLASRRRRPKGERDHRSQSDRERSPTRSLLISAASHRALSRRVVRASPQRRAGQFRSRRPDRSFVSRWPLWMDQLHRHLRVSHLVHSLLLLPSLLCHQLPRASTLQLHHQRASAAPRATLQHPLPHPAHPPSSPIKSRVNGARRPIPACPSCPWSIARLACCWGDWCSGGRRQQSSRRRNGSSASHCELRRATTTSTSASLAFASASSRTLPA